MDIKQRIDALTEAEAKAVLGNLINVVGYMSRCSICILRQKCNKHSPDYRSCEERIFDWSLGEFTLRQVQNEIDKLCIGGDTSK